MKGITINWSEDRTTATAEVDGVVAMAATVDGDRVQVSQPNPIPSRYEDACRWVEAQRRVLAEAMTMQPLVHNRTKLVGSTSIATVGAA